MKTILILIVILSLFAMAPGTPGPQKTKPPTEPPPVETLPPPPPPPTEPPVETQPPPVVTEKATPESAPTEGSYNPHPETQATPGSGKPGRVIKLPQGGYGPQPEHGLYYWMRWFLLVLVGFVGVWAAGWSLKR